MYTQEHVLTSIDPEKLFMKKFDAVTKTPHAGRKLLPFVIHDGTINERNGWPACKSVSVVYIRGLEGPNEDEE